MHGHHRRPVGYYGRPRPYWGGPFVGGLLGGLVASTLFNPYYYGGYGYGPYPYWYGPRPYGGFWF